MNGKMKTEQSETERSGFLQQVNKSTHITQMNSYKL